MVEVQVENMVVSFSVSSSLDLQKLAEILPDAQYKPDDVPALIIQFPNPRSMAAFTAAGTVVITGPKSMEEVQTVAKMVLDRLRVIGVQPQETPQIQVQNVTISSDFHQSLKLRSIAKSLHTAEYTPRVFPGLVYKEDDPNTIILLFDSGKIICNGTNLEDVTAALNKMVEKLLSFGIKKEEDECPK